MKKIFICLLLFDILVFITSLTIPVAELDNNAEVERFFANQTSKQISPEIIDDLSEFTKLIPQADIDLVIAEHFVFDFGFIKAFEFLKSSKFIDFLNKLQTVEEIVDLLDFLHILVPRKTEPDLSVPYLEIVLLEAVQAQKKTQTRHRRSPVRNELIESNNTQNLHSFIGAVREILSFLPHEKYSNLIKEKCAKSDLFSSFYKALRSSEFRPKVEKALASKNMVPFISTLNSNSIDVKTLAEIAFNVISWGPNVQND